jgi:membrane protease subunit HflK
LVIKYKNLANSDLYVKIEKMSFYKENPWQKEEVIYPKRDILSFDFRKFPLKIIVGIALLFFLFATSFYTIQPNEVGVVLRFGKFVKTTLPGLHFKLPFGIERVFPVKVEYIYKEEFGFRTKKPGVRTLYEEKGYEEESLILTGDLNVLDIEWIVQFKIKDPFAVLFNVRDVRKTLRDLSESVMRKIVGDYTFNEVLTTKRMDINKEVQEKLQEILDSYQAGIQIVTVKLQDVNPPDPVKPAFNEVNEAKQEREKLINQAWQVYNQKIPQAKGEALKMIKEAEGYAQEVINKAKGETQRFLLLLEEYKKAKEVTLRRIYLEKISQVLKKAGKKYIIDPEQGSILPLLKLKDESE